MKTFDSQTGGMAQSSVPSTPANQPMASSQKQMDVKSVYMLFEELKKSFEDGSKVTYIEPTAPSVDTLDTDEFRQFLSKTVAEGMKLITFKFEEKPIDYSKFPKPVDNTEELKALTDAVNEKDSQTAEELKELKEEMAKLNSNLSKDSRPQKIEKTIFLDPKSWKCLGCVIISFAISMVLGVWLIINENQLDQYKDSDLKYRFIQMNEGACKAGLDSIEVWFLNRDHVSQIEKTVVEYEQRMEDLRRSEIESKRLQEHINELNSQNAKK